MIVCPKCGCENQEHYEFCLGCGSDFHQDAEGETNRTTSASASIPAERKNQAKNSHRKISTTGRASILLLLLGCLVAIGFVTGFFEPRLPAVLDLNEEIVITDREETVSGTAIMAGSANCKITIKNSKIRADRFVEGGQNIEITIINSEIITQNDSLLLSGNAEVRIFENSTIKSLQGSAINTQGNCDLQMRDSTIEGKQIGFKTAGWNASISLSGKSLIKGGEEGINCSVNCKVENTDGRIVGKRLGIKYELNGDLSLNRSSVAGDVAVKAGDNFELRLLDGVINGIDVGLSHGRNGELLIEKGLINGRIGIQSKGLELKMNGGKIDGIDYGIHVDGGMKLTLQNGIIEADVAVHAMSSSDFIINSGRITGQKCGIRIPSSRYSSRINFSGGSIYGKEIGIIGGRVEIRGASGELRGEVGAAELGYLSTIQNSGIKIVGAVTIAQSFADQKQEGLLAECPEQ